LYILLGSSGQVLAEPSKEDKATATELFKVGRELLDQGHVSEACRKLEESQRLDPGGGTLLNVAVCHEREGRTATAWSDFTEALGIAKRDGRQDRREIAEQHIAALEKALSRLVILVPSEADLPDLTIKRDGSVVGRPTWGLKVPIDPGEHVIEAGASGKASYRQPVSVGAGGEVKTISIPKLDDAPKSEATKVVAPAPIPSSTEAPASTASAPPVGNGSSRVMIGGEPPAGSERPQAAGSGSAQRLIAFVALGVGAGGLGAGSYFGLQAISKKNQSNDACGTTSGACGSQSGAQESRDAVHAADLATVGFGIGIVGVATGVVLLLTAPSAHTTAFTESPSRSAIAVVPAIGAREAAMSVSGAF
jgi:hypothetical protein